MSNVSNNNKINSSNYPEEEVITIRMLEAHFRGIQILLDYVQRKKNVDPSANKALRAFHKIRREEGMSLDQSEAVFGFAAFLSQLQPSIRIGATDDAVQLAQLAMEFCKINEMPPPAKDYAQRLRMPNPNRLEEVAANQRKPN